MQKAIRINDSQIIHLSHKARKDNTALCGYLHKRSSDTGKWQPRYFVLFQNLLFYYESDKSERPSGAALLEGCYCDKYISVKLPDKSEKQQSVYCFNIYYKKDGQRQYDLRAESEMECNMWVEAIKESSYAKLVEGKEELDQKHLHLLQILDSERQAKWHYVQQTEELSAEVKKLKTEVRELKDSCQMRRLSKTHSEETEELQKIKKVQSFFRGWLCRRRWKQIVEEYIRSEHAELMRKRNAIVFGLVECEEEYVQQISILVSCFLRPFKMAASAKKPIITHEDVNSVFLNAETLLFLHQIFLQGLHSKMDNWPTLQLGDLFDMLLPMLSIYQEYVRNHHYSLQVLAEYKQKTEFSLLLKRYEEKAACEGRSIETFLTYPMHQIPRYIVTLHELLAHTPHDHVDRQKLEFSKGKLEELSHVMHDEVSETENIRKNLAIERMIVEGCDILLDVNQIFVRQGTLVQVLHEKYKNHRARLGSFSSSFTRDSKKEIVAQVFLFTNHLIISTRASNGRLHLVKNIGKIPLADCALVEDTASTDLLGCFEEDGDNTHTTINFLGIELPKNVENRVDYNGLDFRLIVDNKSGPPTTVTLVSNTLHEKAAWCSDINQCIEQIHYSDLLNSSLAETSSVSMPHTIRSDPKLFKDDFDIKFSRTLNSCKVPQIRHASVERLLDRLTDLRFLSIDFLNTFLLTYRVFTDSETVIAALKRVLNNPECGNLDPRPSFSINTTLDAEGVFGGSPPGNGNSLLINPQLDKTRRISTGMMKIEVASASTLTDTAKLSTSQQYRTGSLDATSPTECTSSTKAKPKSLEKKLGSLLVPPVPPNSVSCNTPDFEVSGPDMFRELSDVANARLRCMNDGEEPTRIQLQRPQKLAPIASCEIVTDDRSRDNSDEDIDIKKRVRIGGVTEDEINTDSSVPSSPRLLVSSPAASCAVKPILVTPKPQSSAHRPTKFDVPSMRIPEANILDHTSLSPGSSPQVKRPVSPRLISPASSPKVITKRSSSPVSHTAGLLQQQQKESGNPFTHQFSWPRGSVISWSGAMNKRSSNVDIEMTTSPRSSLTKSDIHGDGSPPFRPKAGAVVTSSRASKRRSSNTAAALAFAVATAGSANPLNSPGKQHQDRLRADSTLFLEKRLSVICTAATMRVLNVIRHWVYKFPEDVEADQKLKTEMESLLEDLVCNQSLIPPDHKAVLQILSSLRTDTLTEKKPDLELLLKPNNIPSTEAFDTLSALDIAEQLTYIDHQIFRAIRSEELLMQAWMKDSKNEKATHVLLVSKRFNAVSRLVVSEIVSRSEMNDRVSCIEKWAAIADICRCLHNYNGVLEICAAFVNSSVYRLKKTWEKLSKQSKMMIDKLQCLVSSDGRFKNMREALHRCDPPCIPYLGVYLTDLSFIEEGTTNLTEDGLVNFCKMRMIAHVIREIQQYQQTPYRIEHNKKVCAYLLDPTRQLEDEKTYTASLKLEPRPSIGNIPPPVTQGRKHSAA